jgi:hypothetical protein
VYCLYREEEISQVHSLLRHVHNFRLARDPGTIAPSGISGKPL